MSLALDIFYFATFFPAPPIPFSMSNKSQTKAIHVFSILTSINFRCLMFSQISIVYFFAAFAGVRIIFSLIPHEQQCVAWNWHRVVKGNDQTEYKWMFLKQQKKSSRPWIYGKIIGKTTGWNVFVRFVAIQHTHCCYIFASSQTFHFYISPARCTLCVVRCKTNGIWRIQMIR